MVNRGVRRGKKRIELSVTLGVRPDRRGQRRMVAVGQTVDLFHVEHRVALHIGNLDLDSGPASAADQLSERPRSLGRVWSAGARGRR